MIRMEYPLITLTALWIMLYRDHLGLIRISLLCSVLHEMGHIAVWILIKKTLPEICVSFKGIGMKICESDFTPNEVIALAIAGPTVNFLLAFCTWIGLQNQASYWGYFFVGINLLIGGFNLLPIGSLDGKRVLENLLL